MRERLDRGGVAVDYQVARSNDAWPDHRARTLVTGSLIAWLKPDSIFDPACGDGSVVLVADSLVPIRKAILGDVSVPSMERLVREAPRRGWEYRQGPMEGFGAMPDVGLVILTEILEHLPDPDAILRMAKDHSRYLVASSPVMRPGQQDSNPEHLWQFDRAGYEDMLNDAGWIVEQYTFLHFPSEYDFGIWVCR